MILPALLSNGMILQQGKPIPVKGRARPFTGITAAFLGRTVHIKTDSAGAWQLALEAAAPGGPFTMEIQAEGEAPVRITDIYVGDLWLCSGQSNMEVPMSRLKDNFPEEWESPNQLIRQFKVPQEWDFTGPRDELTGGAWMPATSETLDSFSGTAWFFARERYKKYPVPLGLIHAAMGGTPVEAWMSREALAGFPGKIAQGEKWAGAAVREGTIARHHRAVEAWQAKTAREDRGALESWQGEDLDDSAWDKITLPGDFSNGGNADGSNAEGFCGVLWLRKTITLPPGFDIAAAKLWLGTIVDADTVFLNGTEIGNTGYRYPPRKYAVPPGLLRQGENLIAIRVFCNNGEGGVTRGKPFRLFAGGNVVELAGSWKCRAGVKTAVRPGEFFIQRQPMGLYNGMISPLRQVPFRGVIWYQGESNTGNPAEYGALFTALINDWRKKFDREDLPFLFVQLPLFGEPEENNEGSVWAIIREAQASALALPATGMAAALDAGEWNDLHPLDKKTVGRRLALAAEAVVYGQENSSPGPMARNITVRDGKLIITFEKCGEGLVTEGQPHVSIAGGEKTTRLPAFIEPPNKLVVDISGVNHPEKILYAWADNPRDRQLYNADKLPAIPFRLKI